MTGVKDEQLIERFNLDPGEVGEVIDETREERHQEMEVRFEEKLNEAVEEGKITEEQKELILEKKTEMTEKREELRNLPQEEKREAMIELRQEMKNWAEENDIDLRMLSGYGLKGYRKGCFNPRAGGFGSQSGI